MGLLPPRSSGGDAMFIGILVRRMVRVDTATFSAEVSGGTGRAWSERAHSLAAAQYDGILLGQGWSQEIETHQALREAVLSPSDRVT